VLSEGVLAPTGTVNLYDNNKKIAGPMPLRYSGPAGPGLAQVNYTASGLEAGFHYFQLTYGGDANHLSLPLNTFSNHGAFVTVNAATGAGTHVGISPSASSVSVGESVTYSVSVAPIKPGALPTGTISLVGQNGGPFTDPVALSSGTASITLNWVFAAQNAITAEYSGDTNYSASNSAVIVTKVSPGTPTVTLTPAASSVSAGTQTSLTVTTLGYSNPNVSLPYGEVSFFDSVNGGPERMLGDGYLTTGNGGNPIFTLPVVLPGGNNVIQVKYRGTQDWKPTVSNSVAVAAE
jgi:Bacterial Ig-like domain (group 3)